MRITTTLLLLSTLLSQVPAADDIAALRAASFFAGLMQGLDVRIEAGALPSAVQPTSPCNLGFDSIWTALETGLPALASAANLAKDNQARDVVSGTQQLARALHGFSTAAHSCSLEAAAVDLSRYAEQLSALNVTHVWPRGRNRPPQLFLDGADISDVMARAGRALQESRYQQAGLALAIMLIQAAGDDDDQPHDGFARGFAKYDPMSGILRGEADLKAYIRQSHSQRLKRLSNNEEGLAAAAPLPLLSGTNRIERQQTEERERRRRLGIESVGVESDGTQEEVRFCCCCWAESADEPQRVPRLY